jgi:hypothetical protein
MEAVCAGSERLFFALIASNKTLFARFYDQCCTDVPGRTYYVRASYSF